MNCPKCDNPMETVTVDDVEIDRCTVCGGMFFDMLEEQDVLARKGSQVDMGDPEIGREKNFIVGISCPRDGAAMMPMVDARQQHIEFESCPACHGRFFDAGEFKDLARISVLDWFRTGKARRARL